ncbi:MAG TPA: HAMP domain-containing sensor histidine kinase, partial [Cryomorphaceae bacterium]|nr:HAMP domain-containing sensor histidine kinase [Cryomorphaceae bacterium]
SENRRYEDALIIYKMLDEVREDIEFERQKSEMAIMEREYEAGLRRAEIQALKEVNEKNEVIKEQQNLFLWIAIMGIIGLTVLSVLLARSNKRRAAALSELEKLNRNLEKEVLKRTDYLREANENIRLQAESISERNENLTELYHMVSHDLRGPINNLTMLVKFLEEARDETDRKQLMDHMNPVLESLSATANQLLEKVDSSSREESDLHVVKFATALNRAKKGLQVELKSAGAVITTDFHQAESVFYSQKYLTSIFYNFLSNSLKYAYPGRTPQIFISTIKDDNGVLLKFSDNGSGIDMEKNREKLFQFKEVFNDRPDAKGIGLYLLKNQIERAGGEIWAESELGQGTDFFVKFKG